MKPHSESQTWLLFIAELALAFFSAVAGAQTGSNAEQGAAQASTPVTLWMEWKRGNNARYGSNFVYLHAPCQKSETCECTMSFKSINSQEFADYISSFGEDKVPVVYEVFYGPDGRARANRLARVGTWTSDRFPPNDRLVAVSNKFQGGAVGARQSVMLHGSEDCFPSAGELNTNLPDQASAQSTAAAGTSTAAQQTQAERKQTAERVRIPQGVSQDLLIKKVQPEYPQDAREKRIQGRVILDAQINEEGSVTGVTLVSGHPLLVPAAMEAVKQWTYKPYSLKGKPVAVETRVAVDFRLPQD